MTWERFSLRLAHECAAAAQSRLLKNMTRRKRNYTSGSLPCFSGGRRRGDQSASIRSAERLAPLFLLPQQKPDNSAAVRGGYFRLPTMETCKKLLEREQSWFCWFPQRSGTNLEAPRGWIRIPEAFRPGVPVSIAGHDRAHRRNRQKAAVQISRSSVTPPGKKLIYVCRRGP